MRFTGPVAHEEAPAPRRRLECAPADATIHAMPPAAGGRLRDYLRALRPHHWVKNVLVFAPLVAAHETRPELYLTAAGVFAALSACASGTYLLNDVVDLPHDRRHPTRRHRPLAAGLIAAAAGSGAGSRGPTSGAARPSWMT